MAAGWPGSKKRKAGGVDSSNKNKVLALPKPVGPVGHLGLGGGAGLGGPEQQVQPEVSAKVQQAALNSVALCSATGALPVGPKQVGAQALGLQLQTAGAASRLAAWRSPASALVGLSGPPVKQELPKETFGYSINVAKSQLCQYCQKRGLSSDIPVSRNGNGPVTARMQIQLPPNRGGVVRQEYTCNGKNAEAVNMVALLMCIELCKRGEMAPFRTKAQQLAEGVRPCSLELSDESMASLRDFEGQLDTYLTGLGTSAQPRSPVGLQLDFDAAAWATTPEAQEITWSPPSWGSSPWGGSEHAAVGGEEEEFNANVQLLAQLQERQASKGFAAMQSQRALLPIASMAQEIIAAIETHAVTLISGSTGCGKTTQVPQLLLEHAIRQNQGTSLNMACTQPRRLAAMAAAERVAEERGEPLGHSVGFIVRFHQVVPRSYASICFMTTGMLLRRLSGRGLRGISHVIIDEVHERDLDTDFLLTVVRNLLLQCPGMRVILMSATIELAKWSRYFGQDFGAGIEIPGRLFPVTTHYLDEVERLTGHVLDQHQQKLESDVPLDLVEKLLMRIVDVSASGDGGAILVFLPGWDSISKLQTRLKKQPGLNSRIQLHTLHSQVPREEQRLVFQPAPQFVVKVILSTNIAETSVTISDVVYVIDSCRVKQLVSAQSGGGRMVYRLMNTMASKQNLVQRAGRAGRVREGVCYRLCSQATYQRLPESLTPEMVRLPLHQVTLTLKSMNLGEAAVFLSQAPDPPPAASVRNAVAMLQDLKALDGQERITTLGMQLAKLPVEPRMGFALMCSCMLGLGEPMAALSALSSAPSPFVNEQWRARDAYRKAENSRTLLSDHHDLLMVYYEFRKVPPANAMFHCSRNNLEYKVLSMVSEATDQTLSILRSMGFQEQSAMPPCDGWISVLGTPMEDPEYKQAWAALTFLMGLGLEHFAVRQEDRRVWVSRIKSSQVKSTAAIPEAPPLDPAKPFFVFSEFQENEWNTSCRGATAVGVVAALLGAARDLIYDMDSQCALLDGWAPVQVQPESARLLGLLKSAIRVCLLQLSHSPQLMGTDPLLGALCGLIASLCEASPS